MRALVSSSRLVCVAAVLITSACQLSAPTLQETRELQTTIADDGRFELDVGAGSLRLTGDEKADAIHVRAEIYQTTANDDYTLALELEEDGLARLVADTASSFIGGSDRIDLSITVPARLNVNINDGSGSITIATLVGDLDIEDGSGSLRVSDVQGNLVVDDGSGSITISDITGNVSIDDGSGSISVENISGKATVSDGSGSIEVEDAGDFELLADGSGSVKTRNIGDRDPGAN